MKNNRKSAKMNKENNNRKSAKKHSQDMQKLENAKRAKENKERLEKMKNINVFHNSKQEGFDKMYKKVSAIDYTDNLHFNKQENKVNKGEITSIKGKLYNCILPKSLENKVQRWKMATKVSDFVALDLEELVSQIKSNDSSPYFIDMRKFIDEYYETGDEELKVKYDWMKAQLPLLSITSLMYPKRCDNNIIEYTGLIVLDIDDKDNEHLRGKYDRVKSIVADDLFTKIASYSPKGKNFGLKIIAEVKLPQAIKDINLRLKEDISDEERKLLIDKLKDFHEKAYSFVGNYYSTKYELNIDKCAKNIQGGTYISADENIYYNPNSSCFEIVWTYCQKPKQIIREYCNCSTLSIPSFELMDNIVEKFFKGKDSGRNNIVFQLAMQVKDYGISQAEVVQYALNRFGASDFDKKEITRAVGNGFKKEYSTFNQYQINKSSNENLG